MENVATSGAVCPAHPEQPLAFACARCGAFACEQCRSGRERNLCPGCSARVAPAAVQVWDSVIEGFRVGANTFVGLLPVLLPYVLLKAAVGYGRDLFVPHGGPKVEAFARVGLTIAASAGGSIAEAALSSFADGVKLQRFADALGGRRQGLGRLVRTALQRYLPLLVVLLVDDLSMAVLALACCVPAMLLSALISFNEQEVVLAGAGPWTALRNSYLLGKRFYWRLVALGTVDILLSLGVVLGATELASALLHGSVFQKAASNLGTSVLALPVSFFSDAILTTLYVRIRAADAAAAQMAAQPGL